MMAFSGVSIRYLVIFRGYRKLIRTTRPVLRTTKSSACAMSRAYSNNNTYTSSCLGVPGVSLWVSCSPAVGSSSSFSAQVPNLRECGLGRELREAGERAGLPRILWNLSARRTRKCCLRPTSFTTSGHISTQFWRGWQTGSEMLGDSCPLCFNQPNHAFPTAMTT